MNILMISDDKKYSGLLKEILEKRDYQIEIVKNGYDGIENSKEVKYDLIIIDIHKEKLSVVQILEMILLNRAQSKVMILKEEENENEELQLLVLGAKEYQSKKKSFNIIMERIVKILEKEEDEEIEVIKSRKENIIIEVENKVVLKNNRDILLTNYEYELLLYLIKNKNKLLTREEIYKEVWQVEESKKDMRSVDTYIKNLRKKLDIKSIISSRGVGYRWCEK